MLHRSVSTHLPCIDEWQRLVAAEWGAEEWKVENKSC